MNKTDIEWCDMTWNPVTGCLHGCPYCYARGIAKRFGGWTTGGKKVTVNPLCDPPELDSPMILKRKDGKVVNAPFPFGFTPTLHRYRLEEPAKEAAGQNVFVCSMSDLFGKWVPTKWITDVFNVCLAAPQHRYLFLTKNPQRYAELDEVALLPRLDNFWYGTTVSNVEQMDKAAEMFDNLPVKIKSFLSIEPIMEDIANSYGWLTAMIHASRPYFSWIIVGAETGSRKGKVVPKREWVETVVQSCLSAGVPVLMKNSLSDIWGKPLIQRFPDQLRKKENKCDSCAHNIGTSYMDCKYACIGVTETSDDGHVVVSCDDYEEAEA